MYAQTYESQFQHIGWHCSFVTIIITYKIRTRPLHPIWPVPDNGNAAAYHSASTRPWQRDCLPSGQYQNMATRLLTIRPVPYHGNETDKVFRSDEVLCTGQIVLDVDIADLDEVFTATDTVLASWEASVDRVNCDVVIVAAQRNGTLQRRSCNIIVYTGHLILIII